MQIWRQLGLTLAPMENDSDVSRSYPQLHGGLRISEVRPDSAASRAGMRQGDILVGLHQWEMTTLDNVLFVLNHADRASFSPLRFYILRGGQVHRGYLSPVPERSSPKPWPSRQPQLAAASWGCSRFGSPSYQACKARNV